MTLATSGIISIQDIATELGISATGLNLNDSRVRSLAGISSGAISIDNLHGKSNSYLIAGTEPGGTKTGYSSFDNQNPSGNLPAYGSVYNIGRTDMQIYEIVTYLLSGTPKLSVTIYGYSYPPITFGMYLNGYAYDSANASIYVDSASVTTTWTWNAPALMVTGVKYSCKLV